MDNAEGYSQDPCGNGKQRRPRNRNKIKLEDGKWKMEL
jgi:hypothetical protein